MSNFQNYFRCQECDWYTKKAKIRIIDIFDTHPNDRLAKQYPIITICKNCGACNWTVEAGKRLVVWWNPFSWFTRKILWRSEIVRQQELKKKQAEALKKHEEIVEREIQEYLRKKKVNLIQAMKKPGIDDENYTGVEPNVGPGY